MTECSRCNEHVSFPNGRVITVGRPTETCVSELHCFLCVECFRAMFSGVSRWF